MSGAESGRSARRVKSAGVPRAAVRVAGCAALLGVAWLGADAALSRPALGRFDPAGMARAEAAMWRSYYEGRWGRLAWQSVMTAREQFGFSMADSVRLGWHAARAARFFRRDTHDPRCLPELEAYYRALARSGAAPGLDAGRAARLELQWWRERRERPAGRHYAVTVGELAELVYGLPPGAATEAAALRTGAMDYRDARRNGLMTEADWAEVARRLEAAYAALKRALEARAGQGRG